MSEPIRWIDKKILQPVGRFVFGSEPNLNPKDILEEINQNSVMQKIAKNEICLQSDYQELHTPKGKAAIALIQRALIALDLIKVNRNEKFWWRPPIIAESLSGGFAWGEYGPKTVDAIAELQKQAGDIPPVKDFYGKEHYGVRFGPQTLKALKQALEDATKVK